MSLTFGYILFLFYIPPHIPANQKLFIIKHYQNKGNNECD